MDSAPLDVSSLYERHHENLLLFLLRRTADPEIALDLWAETFAQAVAGRRRFRGGDDDRAAAWLYGIARRQLAMYYRKGKAEQRAIVRLGIERPRLDPTAEAELLRQAHLAEIKEQVALAARELPGETREAVELRVVRELPYSEVARALGVTEGAARVRVSRGLKSLARALEGSTLMEVSFE